MQEDNEKYLEGRWRQLAKIYQSEKGGGASRSSPSLFDEQSPEDDLFDIDEWVGKVSELLDKQREDHGFTSKLFRSQHININTD